MMRVPEALAGRTDVPRPAMPSPDDVRRHGRLPAFGLLDNIRSVWNVGSMFRTADAVALGGLYLAGMTATPPRPDMEKTALGATRTVPWDYWADSLAAARHARDAGLPLIVLEQAPRARDWEEFACPFPHCFVVGHEVNGVRPEILALADEIVEIPMAGAKQSLNVAVGFGLLAYEIRRRWLRREAP
jgi:tRNA G18 (ribose-2'-O)-methylase SpoU